MKTQMADTKNGDKRASYEPIFLLKCYRLIGQVKLGQNILQNNIYNFMIFEKLSKF